MCNLSLRSSWSMILEIRSLKLTKAQKIQIANTEELHKILSQILKREGVINQEKEHFWFVGLNSQDYILCIDTVSLGSVSSTQITPMSVFRNGVWKGCTYAILAHNHPSGLLEPSDNDIDVTDRLCQCGIILNIIVRDHIIITPTTYLSFKDQKMMRKIEKSIKYVPPYQLKERWAKEGEKIRHDALEEGRAKGLEEGLAKGLAEGEEIGLVKIVKSMLEKDYSLEQIIEVTGLGKEDIEKILKKIKKDI